MPVNPVAENICGTLGTILWCIQLVPQAWKSFHEKSTKGLSAILLFMWACASLPLGVYNISETVNIPLIVQPQLFGLLCALCWAQCLYYDQRRPLGQVILIYIGLLTILAVLQVAFVFAVRHGLQEDNQRPLQFFGVMTAILIFCGLFPQYYEIWKLNEVVGISIIFMAVDLLGGLFSALSLVFKPSFDPLLGFSYIGVVVLDGGVILLSFILNPRARKRRERATRADEEARTVEVNVEMARAVPPATRQDEPLKCGTPNMTGNDNSFLPEDRDASDSPPLPTSRNDNHVHN